MVSIIEPAPTSNKMLWSGRVVAALAIIFMVLDAILHALKPAPVVQAFDHLGFPLSTALTLSIIVFVSVAVYAIPRTSVLGAILLSGYLGGAVSSHLRVSDPLFDTLFPIGIGVLVWGGLYLRDDRLRALIPLRR
jgi:DoxX-like family